MWRPPILGLLKTALRGSSRHMAGRKFLHTLRDEDLEDEEQLARLLVQDVSAPPTQSTVTAWVSTGVIESQELVRAHLEGGVEVTAAEDNTLADAMFVEGESAESLPSSSPITPTRRANNHLAKYSHIRQAIHTKRLKDGAKLVGEAALEWMCCGCRTYNFIGRRTCRSCKQSSLESCKHNTAPARHLPLFPAIWTCHSCGHNNNPCPADATNRSKFSCESCGDPFPGIREWYCPSCCHINSRGSVQCATCYADRPFRWSCSSCGHDKNSIFFTECRNCHSVRRRLVSDSTVLCPSCRQRNDVQWEMCFMCMTPLGMMNSVRKLQLKVESGLAPEDKSAANSAVEDENCAQPNNRGGTPPTTNDVAEDAGEGKVGPSVECTGEAHDGTKAESEQHNNHREQVQLSLGDEKNTRDSAVMEDCAATAARVKAAERGTWWCTECNVLQRRNVGFCDICLKPRVVVDSREPPKSIAADSLTSETKGTASCLTETGTVLPNEGQCKTDQATVGGGKHLGGDGAEVTETKFSDTFIPFSVNTTETGEWRCPYCRNLLGPTVTSCCGVTREAPFGYWRCSACCSTNRDERARCLGCGAAPQAVKPWRCYMCRRRNEADVFQCDYCGSAHPRHWVCGQCGSKCQQSGDSRCSSCGSVKKKLEVVVCPHCSVPNNFLRKSCFRCRARLVSDDWHCEKCGYGQNGKNSRRCTGCGEPRRFNMDEITWVCDVCSTAVASGGALKERKQCPRCNSDRTERSLEIPSRWQCRSCGVANAYSVPACLECGNARRLGNMRTHTSCRACFRLTFLDEKERCEHCGAVMSEVINDVGSLVSSSGLHPLVRGAVDSLSVAEGTRENGCISPTPAGVGPRDDSFIPGTLSPFTATDHRGSVVANMITKDVCGVSFQPIDSSVCCYGPKTLDTSQEEGDTVECLLQCSEEGSGTETSAPESCLVSDAEEWCAGDLGCEELDETVYVINGEWCESIPSWICSNCEAKNLDEADVCVDCGIAKCDK